MFPSAFSGHWLRTTPIVGNHTSGRVRGKPSTPSTRVAKTNPVARNGRADGALIRQPQHREAGGAGTVHGEGFLRPSSLEAGFRPPELQRHLSRLSTRYIALPSGDPRQRSQHSLVGFHRAGSGIAPC